MPPDFSFLRKLPRGGLMGSGLPLMAFLGGNGGSAAAPGRDLPRHFHPPPAHRPSPFDSRRKGRPFLNGRAQLDRLGL